MRRATGSQTSGRSRNETWCRADLYSCTCGPSRGSGTRHRTRSMARRSFVAARSKRSVVWSVSDIWGRLVWVYTVCITIQQATIPRLLMYLCSTFCSTARSLDWSVPDNSIRQHGRLAGYCHCRHLSANYVHVHHTLLVKLTCNQPDSLNLRLTGRQDGPR